PWQFMHRARWTAVGTLAAGALVAALMLRLGDRGAALWFEFPRLTALFAASSPLPRRTLPMATLLLSVDPLDQHVVHAGHSSFEAESRVKRTQRVMDIDQAAAAQPPAASADRGIPVLSSASSAGDGAAQFNGMLGVESMPSGAVVFINRRRIGETPLRFVRVP